MYSWYQYWISVLDISTGFFPVPWILDIFLFWIFPGFTPVLDILPSWIAPCPGYSPVLDILLSCNILLSWISPCPGYHHVLDFLSWIFLCPGYSGYLVFVWLAWPWRWGWLVKLYVKVKMEFPQQTFQSRRTIPETTI